MKKKFTQIGKKTGLDEKKLRNMIKVGFSGLLALALSAFSGSAQAAGPATNPARQHSEKPPLTEKCQQKPEKGPCKAISWKYYFNQKSNSCDEFLYGGCEGVVPFETKEECQSTCVDPQSGNPRSDPQPSGCF
ncbi:MAG: BPTI/Kunitz domain-containing protein [Geobacteraceae bacterium]